MESVPKISIITVAYNSASTIYDTVQSVISQTYPNVEYIIVDGASTDDTLSVVRRYADSEIRIFSEPDRGIYDAMNKGLTLATGEIIGFLHADDVYAHSGILSDVARVFEINETDSCYGDLVYVDRVKTDKIIRYWKAGLYDVRRFYHGWMPPHPTFFVRRGIYEMYGAFSLDMGTAADYELMLRFLLKHKIKAAYIPEIMVRMRTGGKSNATTKNRILANRMDRLAWKINGLKPFPWTLLMKPLSKISQFLVTAKRARKADHFLTS